MPTASERAGDLSPALQIPADRISPQSRALLNLYPLPNFFGSAAYNYQIPIVGVTHQDSVQLRLNKNLNVRHQFGGFLDAQSTRTDNANIFGFLDKTSAIGFNVGLNWTYRTSPRSATTFRYQFSRQRTRVQVTLMSRSVTAEVLRLHLPERKIPACWLSPDLLDKASLLEGQLC
jgi:hypothetical protein